MRLSYHQCKRILLPPLTLFPGFCKLLTCAKNLYSLFYFCGHGFEEHGKTYLVPVDMEAEWDSRAAISAEEILADIQSQGTTSLDVLLLDVCRTLERYHN